MVISSIIDFEVIKHKSRYNWYPTLVGLPCERKMKTNVSLDKDRIKLKGRGKKIIIPLDPREGKPWDELDDGVEDVCQIYKII